jgi:hypothetical protein
VNLGGSLVTEDIGDLLINGYDAILCTQVMQYMPFPADELHKMRNLLLGSRGWLVLTYPTHWPEVEHDDLWRFTRAGMTRLLVAAGFLIERHERRHVFYRDGDEFAVGYGVLARVP